MRKISRSNIESASSRRGLVYKFSSVAALATGVVFVVGVVDLILPTARDVIHFDKYLVVSGKPLGLPAWAG